jgi:outer membrane protein insertion porin family
MCRCLSILFIISVSLISNLYAQNENRVLPLMDYSQPAKYEIAEVTVSGINYLDPIVVLNIANLQPGRIITVPGEDITKALEKLWGQGLFSDVKITATKIEGNKIYLDVYLQEPPRLARLTINGLKKAETTEISDKLNLRSGSLITENVLNTSEEIIIKHFVAKGFFSASVELLVEDEPSIPNRVNLTINVDKSDRVKVADVILDGNSYFSDRRLQRTLKKTKKKNWNFFRSSKFIEAEFQNDKENLITFYNENGFRDAKILADSIYLISEDRVNVYILLREGPKYYLRNITWRGNSKYPDELLNAVLDIKKGDVFDQTKLDKRLTQDEDAVSSLYLDDGYLFFSVTPVEMMVDNDSIDLEMRIMEGPQATINRVIITGNTKTNEHVIRRELRTRPGELFNKTNIIRSSRELAVMGHFDPEKLGVNPIPNPADGTVDIEFVVEEKANDQLEISGGWGAGMLIGTLGVRFSNFSTRNFFKKDAWRPLPSGDGQTLSIRAQSNGSYYQGYNMTFVEPWLGGHKPTSLSLSAFHTIQTDRFSRTQKEWASIKISGASVGIGKRLKWPDDFFTLYNEVSFQNYNLNDWGGGFFLFSNGNSNNFSFKTTLARNSLDQTIYPRRGSQFSLTLQLTPPFSLFSDKDYTNLPSVEKYKWIEYHKWTFKSQTHTNLVDKLVLTTGVQFGFLAYYNKDYGFSPFEGFDLGGDGMSGYNLYGRETISLRGYENGSVTPIRQGSKAGNIYNKLTLELRYPLSLNPSATIYGLVFLEGGNAWADFKEFNPFEFKRSAGVGLRAFLPMFGLLGVDWGYGFDNIPGRPGANKGQFHFVLGQQF